MHEAFRTACDEIATVGDRLDPECVEGACRLIAKARHCMLYGCGREALQLKGLAMRLSHLGLSVSVQGDMTAPPLGPGDLFLVSAGPGELSTVTALMQAAKNAGAQILFLTAEPETPSAALADLILTIPAQTMARDLSAPTSTLPMGSLYEGALFILFEVMIARLGSILGETPQNMRSRHTNME